MSTYKSSRGLIVPRWGLMVAGWRGVNSASYSYELTEEEIKTKGHFVEEEISVQWSAPNKVEIEVRNRPETASITLTYAQVRLLIKQLQKVVGEEK